MSLNIKNEEVTRLVEEVAAATGETKTEAIRKALEERKQRLALPDRSAAEERFRLAQQEFFAKFPPSERKMPTRDEMDALFE